MFIEPIVCKGLNSNRIFEDSDCIFVPLSKNWREKLTPQHQAQKGKDDTMSPPSEQVSSSKGEMKSAYRLFLNSAKSLSNMVRSDNYQAESSEQGSKVAPDAYSYGATNISSKLLAGHLDLKPDQVEGKVVYIKSTPLKNKELVLKLFKDKNHGLIGTSYVNRNLPDFIIDTTPVKEKDIQKYEGKVVICQYKGWNKEKTHPYAIILNPSWVTGNYLETMILVKEFGLPLETYEQSHAEKLRADEQGVKCLQGANIEEESASRKDYQDRFVMSIESDYYINKELTFSIQSEGNTENEITLYLPDIDYFFPHNSMFDLECRKRYRTFNLPELEYPMLPPFANDNIYLKTGDVRLAIAATVKIDPTPDGQLSLNFDRPVILEKCIIKPSAKRNYQEIEQCMMEKEQNGEETKGRELDGKIREYIKRLEKISNYITEVVGDPSQILPLDHFLLVDYIDKQSNFKLSYTVNVLLMLEQVR